MFQDQDERFRQRYALVPHPATPPRTVDGIDAQIVRFGPEAIVIAFAVRGCADVVLPAITAPARTDGLWQATCFEAFLRSGSSDAYVEMNFSPSSAWAAYSFDRYRGAMRDLPLRRDPEVTMSDRWVLTADFDVPPFPAGPVRIGLSAVIAETGGVKSYWALRHPPGMPDFHHETCFALELPALATP